MPCPNSAYIVCDRDGQRYHAKPDCMNWDCDYCRPKKIKLLRDLVKTSTERHEFLYVGTIIPKDWNRLYRRLGEYFRTEIGDKRAYLVISTKPFKWSQKQTRDACISVADHLIQRLKKPETQEIYRPVSTSRSWGPEKKKSVSRFVSYAPPKSNRRSPLPSVRFNVMKRDGYKCQLCGRNPRDHGVVLVVDHIVPYATGGKTEIQNLWTLCHECNAGKGKKSL
jgi:5-methylcytosine-specific restriction endonuclease McrA